MSGHPQHPPAGRARADRPEVVQAAAQDHASAGDALPRPVRHRVHHRAGQALDAADPDREAHRGRRVPDRLPARRRGPDHHGRGAANASPATSSASCCSRSSTRRRSASSWPRGWLPRPGAAVGGIVFDNAPGRGGEGGRDDVILVRRETSPEDLPGMVASKGVLTTRGGKTSHAAVVARGMGMCAVVRRRVDHRPRRRAAGRRQGAQAWRRDRDRRRHRRGLRRRRAGGRLARDDLHRRRHRGRARGGRRRPGGARAGRRRAPPAVARRRRTPAAGARQRRQRRGRGAGTQARRRGHRPVPHRAPVPRRPAGPDRARGPLGDRRRA